MRKSTGRGSGPGLSGNVCQLCGLAKQSYQTRAAAKYAARVVAPGKRLRVYQCGSYWHLTSMPAAKMAQGRERKLPMVDDLTERDFPRLEAAARRQMARNRQRLGMD